MVFGGKTICVFFASAGAAIGLRAVEQEEWAYSARWARFGSSCPGSRAVVVPSGNRQ